jgi:hypothetical protein
MSSRGSQLNCSHRSLKASACVDLHHRFLKHTFPLLLPPLLPLLLRQADRKEVLQKCLARISQEVEAAAEQGVAVQYPIGGCTHRVLRLLVDEAAILNSRDKVSSRTEPCLPCHALVDVERLSGNAMTTRADGLRVVPAAWWSV